MSVLIKGMDMPKAGTTITVCELEGQLYASVDGTGLCPLVPVPKIEDLLETLMSLSKQ